MAATVSSPWGKPGAWALDAEEHEDELKHQPDTKSVAPEESDFPSLSAAAAATKQPKKKKAQTVSLAEFAYGSAKPSSQPAFQAVGRTHEDLLNLPTGPRQRSADELDKARLGGGFKSYGMNSRNGDDSSNSRWGGGGGLNSRDSRRDVAPSRADEHDDWSRTKKPASFGTERRERDKGSSFFDSQSKADESNSWVSNKPTETKKFGFEKRGSFDSLSRGDRYGYGSSNGGSSADSDNWGRKKDDSYGTGTAATRPKLLLQPRTLPVSNDNGATVKPKGSSPFGNARPREEVLAEKGKDWKEIEEKLESAKITSSKEPEKGERGNAASSARWSFGNGRGGSGSEPRTWRKPDTDLNSRPGPESGEGSESGHASENGDSTQDEQPEGH